MHDEEVLKARKKLEEATINLEKEMALLDSRIKYNRDMEIQVVCPMPCCSTVSKVWVNADDYSKWRRRDKMMDAMPYLTPDEREVVRHGICSACFDRTKDE